MADDSSVVDILDLKNVKRYQTKSDLKTPRKHPSWADVCDDEEEAEAASNDDEDDAGSLVDFIADDDDEEEIEDENDQNNEVQIKNIIYSGKRIRRRPQRYEDELFATEEYKKMMLCDIPASEMEAALVDDDFSEDEDYEQGDEDEDDEYEEEEEEEEEDEECDEQEEENDEGPLNKRTKREDNC